jgi:hypothetical protein
VHPELRGKVGPIRQHQREINEQLVDLRQLVKRHLFELGRVSVAHPDLVDLIFIHVTELNASVQTLNDDITTLLELFDSAAESAENVRTAKHLERQAEYKARRAHEMQEAARSARYDVQRCVRTVEHVSASAIDNRLLFGAWVYLIKAGNGDLLYVGQSRNLLARLSQHQRKDWFPDDGSVDLLPCTDVEHALRVERDLITELRPVHNVMHNMEGNT